jgi:hypothetical protein
MVVWCLGLLDRSLGCSGTGQIASIIGTALPTSSNFFINYAIVQVGWDSLVFTTAVLAIFLCHARRQPAGRAPLHPWGSVFKMSIALCRLSLLWYVLTSSQDASSLSLHLMHIIIMHSLLSMLACT